MKIHTFWILLMKVMGLFLIVDSITVIPQILLTTFQTFGYDLEGSIAAIAVLLLTAFLYFLIMRFLILFPEKIIHALKLNSGLEDVTIMPTPIPESIYAIAAIVFGAYLFVESLPAFCKAVVDYYQEEALSGHFGDKPSARWVVYHGVRMAAAYYIVRYHAFIADFLKKKTTQKQNEKSA